MAWVNGTCTITAVYKQQSPIVAPYLNSGGSVPLSPSCSVNGSGQLSATVTDVKFIAAIFQLTWQFTVCPNISQQAGKSACGVTQIPVTGASPSLTGQLNLPAPRIGGGVGAYAYADIEVASVYNNFYWNIISNTCRQFGTGWAPCATGGGSTGTVNAGAAWQLSWYPGPGSTNTVGPATNLWMLNPSASSDAVNTFLASLTGGSDVVLIPPSFPQLSFANPHYVEMIDMRVDAMTVQIGSAGVACDENKLFATVVSGTNTINVGSSMSASNVGQFLSVPFRSSQFYGGTQSTWFPKIIGYNFPVITLSSNAPFSYTGWTQYGTDNTANAQTIFNNAEANYPIWIPTNCRILTGPIQWNNAQSVLGQQSRTSGFVSKIAQDILQQPDANGQGNTTQGGVRVENVGFTLDSPLDPTVGAITDYDLNGAATVRPPLYRPTHMCPEAQDCNYPLGPGWMTNANNGVASIAQNSALLCIPNALGRLPATGQVVVFPYTTAVFTSTIASTAGSCPSGSTARTMAAPLPNTSGYTQAQAEFMYGTAVQQITSNIPANPTLPLTVNLSLPTQPVPGFESNFAAFGHVRFGSSECDYIGNGQYGTQITLRNCNAISSPLTGPFTVVPTSPCAARNQFYAATDMPYPVFPNLNSGDSTPSGASFYSGWCVGAAALSFPQANGDVFVQAGLVHAKLDHLEFDLTDETPFLLNGTAPIYMAGNTGTQNSELSNWSVNNYVFGPTQGPASAGQHGVKAFGPTGIENNYRNMALFTTNGLTIVNAQSSSFDTIYGNSTWVNPFDDTNIANGTCYFFGYTLDEQTGGIVSNASGDTLSNAGCEPEGGSNIANTIYAQLDQAAGIYTNDILEGAFTVIGGQQQRFSGTTMGNPVIDYGQGNHLETIPGLNTQYITNQWPFGLLNWGINGDCSFVSGQSFGPSIPCAPGYTQPVSGRSVEASEENSIFENPQTGIITGGEWNTQQNLDTNPMQVSNVIDPTEPFIGRYAGCNLGSGALCTVAHFDNFNGFIVVSPNGRIAPVAYNIAADFKSASASGQFTLTIGTVNPSGGSCGTIGTLATYTVTTTTSWPARAWQSPTPVNFAGRAGCAITVALSGGTTTDQYRVGKFDFYPVPNQIPLPAASPTVGTSCTGPNAIIGANSSGPLSCFGGVVVQGAGSSPFQSLTTSGSSGPSTLISGVLNIPNYATGGSSISLTTSGTTGAATLISGVLNVPNYTSPVQSLTTTGTSGPASLVGGVLNIPNYASSGTQTICSGTVSLGTSAIASGAAASTVTATCTGLLSTDNIMLDFNGSPLGVVGYQPSTSGTLTIVKWPTANVLNVAVVNNTSSSVTPGAITLNYRAVR